MVKEKCCHWVCSTRCIREGVANEYTEPFDYCRFNSPYLLCGFPNLDHDLATTMSSYNKRTLSVPVDALTGVTGILEIFSRVFQGGFLYSLPLMYFHAARMWVNYSSMKKRIRSGKQHSILSGSRLPSWSWLGWETSNIKFRENDGTLEDDSYITYCLSQWYSHESPTSIDKRSIGSYFPNTKQDIDGDDSNSRLGHGWTAHEYNSKTDGPGYMVRRKIVYRHSSMPHRVFWRWFPINHPDNDTASPMPPQHAFISCKTMRGWFRATQGIRVPDPRLCEFDVPEADVFDKKGKCCGRLFHPSRWDATGLPASGSG